MTEKELAKRLINALVSKAAEILPKGSRLALYGSRARGDQREDSDWDIHILIPGDEHLPWSNWDIYAWPFADIGVRFNQLVSPRLYSLNGCKKRSFLPFYKNVERDKQILFEN